MLCTRRRNTSRPCREISSDILIYHFALPFLPTIPSLQRATDEQTLCAVPQGGPYASYGTCARRGTSEGGARTGSCNGCYLASTLPVQKRALSMEYRAVVAGRARLVGGKDAHLQLASKAAAAFRTLLLDLFVRFLMLFRAVRIFLLFLFMSKRRLRFKLLATTRQSWTCGGHQLQRRRRVAVAAFRDECHDGYIACGCALGFSLEAWYVFYRVCASVR